MAPAKFLTSAVRALRWHRRLFAAAFAALGVLAALTALAPTSSGVPVVAAARTVPGGARLTEADLTVVRLPAAATPEGALSDPAALVGRTVVAPVPPRQVVTEADLLDSARQVGPGKVALPARFAENSAVGLLRVGARIDVLGADAGGAGYPVVASDVRVVAIPQPEAGLLGAGADGLVLLELTSAQAGAVAAAAAAGGLAFALR